MFNLVTTQLRKARNFVSKGLAFAGAAASVLDPRLNSYLEDGEDIALARVQTALARWIDDDHDRLESLEVTHLEALEKLRQLQTRRNAQGEQLYKALLGVRSTFETAFGASKAAEHLGLDPGLSSVGDDVLRRYARKAVVTLEGPAFAAPAIAFEGVWGDPSQHAAQVRTYLEPFEASLAEIRDQRVVVETAQRERTDLLNQLETRLMWSTRIIEGILHLAGLGFHADRLRTPISSRSSSSEPPEPVVDPGGGPEPEPVEEAPPIASEGPGGSEPPPASEDPPLSGASA